MTEPTKLKKFHVYGKVVGSKYCGYVMAKDKADAEAKVDTNKETTLDLDVSFCHACSDQCEDPYVETTDIEEDK
jgi:hypothetical protein